MVVSIIIDAEAGINHRLFQKVGFISLKGILSLIITSGHTVDQPADDLPLAQQSCCLKIIKAGKVTQGFKPEMIEECRAGSPSQRASWCTAAAPWFYPAKFKQDIDGATRQADAPDFLNLGPGDWLVIGDNGKHFQRGP